MRGPNRAAGMRIRRGVGSLAGMRRLTLPVVLAGACLLAACGSTASGGPPATGQATARPAATATGAPSASGGTAGAVACLPVDTPVDKAPPAIANVWRDRDVMIVPACSVFDVKLPAFVNLARNGGLSDAEAKRIAEARIRSEQMVNWGLRTGQLNVADSLSAVPLYTAPALDAVHAGYSVTSVPNSPGCSIPNKVITLRLSALTVAGMDKADTTTVPEAFGLVVQYGPGDCLAIGTKGSETKTVVPNDPTQVEFVLGGVVRHDPAIGVDYWYYVASGQCGKTAVVAQTCQLAGY